MNEPTIGVFCLELEKTQPGSSLFHAVIGESAGNPGRTHFLKGLSTNFSLIHYPFVY